MRIIIVPLLIILFLGWLLYHLFIRKDLVKQKANMFAGLLFIATWVVIYLLVE